MGDRRTIGATDNVAVLKGTKAKNNGRYKREFSFTLDPCAAPETAALMVVHPTPTPLTANEHLFALSYNFRERFQRCRSVWGTGGPAFKSRRSDHSFNDLAASHPQRPAPVVLAVVHARPSAPPRRRGLNPRSCPNQSPREEKTVVNASVLDRNICHAFEAYGVQAPQIEDAFWRFRNNHDSLCAERLAELAGASFALVAMATSICLPMLSAATDEPGVEWRVRIELDDFVRERLHHFDAACACKS